MTLWSLDENWNLHIGHPCWVCASSFNKTVSYKLDFFLQQAIKEHEKQSARTNRQQISDILPEMSAVNSSGTGRIVVVRVCSPGSDGLSGGWSFTWYGSNSWFSRCGSWCVNYLSLTTQFSNPPVAHTFDDVYCQGWRGVDALMEQRVFTDS